MTIRLTELSLRVAERIDSEVLRRRAATALGLGADEIVGLQIVRRSLDGRQKGRPVWRFQVDVELRDEAGLTRALPAGASRVAEESNTTPWDERTPSGVPMQHRPLVVGTGPAGIFAALVLARAGHPPLVIERGEPVEMRVGSVRRLFRDGVFSAESNYCFGEGGAGTFSDGKLSTGKRHVWIRFLLQEWVARGAPEEILYDAHPHLGSDNLVTIVRRMREDLEASGVEFRFGTRLDDLRPALAAARWEAALSDGSVVPADHVVLAIGHSARDTYAMLARRGLAMQPKAFAIGTRIEHPQALIDTIQFGRVKGLPAADYKLAARVGERGVWSFCMCPGGILLPTGAEEGRLAVNGMSVFARNSGYANSALVVNVRPEDYFRGDVLDGMRFQAELEAAAFQAGGGNYAAPAQRLADFLARCDSRELPASTYRPALVSARLDRLLPSFIRDAIVGAMESFNQKMKGFVAREALLVGVETKTSAPVSMPRDERLQSVSHAGIWPAGEGAGHAGGIVSAALDGLAVARAILAEVGALPTSTQ
ncbi:MAG: NAD(P)/FAD-dependent oxidoreductase [Pirellulaceae bacterium]